MLVKEVADLIGKSDSWVRRLIKDGVLSAKKVGRDWVVSKDSLRRYRNNHPI